MAAQAGILDPVPEAARFLFFSLSPAASARHLIGSLGKLKLNSHIVIGIGHSLILTTGKQIPGLKDFPNYVGAGIGAPSTPYALWVWLRGKDRGVLLHQSRQISEALEAHATLEDIVDSFKYEDGKDLSGYEDGTENPEGEKAMATAIVSSTEAGLNGSSFVAVQKWRHDLKRFDSYDEDEQDFIIGRRKADNEEIDDAPQSAHVKRTAQESFEPEAFMLRRSMPWADGDQAGLMFVAFGTDFRAFDVAFKRMLGLDDGIRDGLFKFTRPLTGSYFWCPPVDGDRLDLRALAS